MSRRILPLAGAIAVAGGGYYLYNAGGNPKVAEKQMEHDASRLSSKVKSELPGSGKEAKTQTKLSGQELGSKFDSGVEQAKAKGSELDKKLEGYGKDAEKRLEETKRNTGSGLTKAVDKFDETVENGAAKAKGGISGWFGGGK